MHRDGPLSADATGASLLGRAAAREADLLDRGMAAVEAGHEAEAHALFTQAVELNPLAERAWFWRAKTAQTLDEVVHCLEAALALDPTSTHIRANLAWAIQRREREASVASQTRLGPAPASSTTQRVRASLTVSRSAFSRALGMARALARTAGAIAAVALGVVWIGGSLPPEVRLALADVNGEMAALLPMLDGSALPLYGQVEVVPGLSALSAVPYGLGFLALLVAVGIMNREQWTSVWAPLLGLGSGWLLVTTYGVAALSVVILLCGLVAVAGISTQAGRSPRHA